MDHSSQERERKKKVNTFPVPFALGEIKTNITINTNSPSKEKIINQAFKFHSQGNISEATKYYQQLISQGCNDHRVFSNLGSIMKDKGSIEEAKKCYLKAISCKADYIFGLF